MRMWILLTIVLFLVLPIIVAEPYLKQPINKNLEVKIPCTLDGASCSSATYCNLTAIYPNSTVFINQSEMSRDNDFFYLNYSNTSVSGDYINVVICCDDNSGSCDKEQFIVRLLGTIPYNVCPDTLESVSILALAIIIIIILIIMAMWLKIGVLGVISSIGLFITSLMIIGCSVVLGIVLLGIGLYFVIFFALQKWY